MQLILNNEPKEFPDGTTVRELLDQIGLSGQFVAVERNREIVPYQTFADAILNEGDVVEVVTLVGGG